MKRQRIFLFTLILVVVTILVWRSPRNVDGQMQSDARLLSDSGNARISSASALVRGSSSRGSGAASDVPVVEALTLAPADVKNLPDDDSDANIPARTISSDDAILAAGGLAVKQAFLQGAGAIDSRKSRLKSILAKDWGGQGNLLVNELRAGKGFEVEFATVETFLRGKDLFGWPEEQRNWIGDEMMTMLRQEMPVKAYELFRDIQADATAPDAMRDYSIQHISHLVADGKAGNEGVVLLRTALESANPVLEATALISLHRLSETSPDLISAEDVRRYAEQSVKSQNERLKMTAQAILKEEP